MTILKRNFILIFEGLKDLAFNLSQVKVKKKVFWERCSIIYSLCLKTIIK